MNKEKMITILIMTGLFGGLIGGPIASLAADYHAPPQKRLWLFIVPEFIGFACVGLMIYYGRSEKSNYDCKSVKAENLSIGYLQHIKIFNFLSQT